MDGLMSPGGFPWLWFRLPFTLCRAGTAGQAVRQGGFQFEASSLPLFQGDAYPTEVLGLTEVSQVLLATASIPHVLPAVTRIEGVPEAIVMEAYWTTTGTVSLMTHFNGLVLYPHFYPF